MAEIAEYTKDLKLLKESMQLAIKDDVFGRSLREITAIAIRGFGIENAKELIIEELPGFQTQWQDSRFFGILAATAEYEARNAADIWWLEDSFQKARDEHLAGVLVLIQADIFADYLLTDYLLSDGRYQDPDEGFVSSLGPKNGFTDFWKTMVRETHNFDGQVLLVHGDSHSFAIDKAMVDDDENPDTDDRSTPNFTRVMVFGSADNSWIEMTVDSHSENVFSFEPVVMPRLSPYTLPSYITE